MAKKLIFEKPLTIAYKDIDLGQTGPDQVRVRTVISGISHGTELTGYTGASPFTTRKFVDRVFYPIDESWPPFYPFNYAGYDAVGIVTQVGANVTRYKVGDRVWVGSQHQTEFLFAQDNTEALVLSPKVPDEEAIMLNLTSIALTAINDAEIKLGDVVAISGGGVVGQLATQQAFASGARRVFLIEPNAQRRQFAEQHSAVETIDPIKGVAGVQIKALNDGQWPDVVVECSGSIQGLQGAIQAAGVGGTVVAAGFYSGGTSGLVLGEEFLHNRITLKASMGVWGCPSRFHQWDRPRLVREAHWLLASRKLNLTNFVSEKFKFDNGQQAYDAIRADPGKYMKAAFVY